MANSTDDTTQKIFSLVVDMHSDLSVMRTDITALRTDVTKIQADITSINTDLKGLHTQVNILTSDVEQMRTDLTQQTGEVTRLGVLFEDMEHNFTATSELIGDNLKVKDKVDDHETRLSEIESLQNILRGAVTEHSRQLKPLLKS